LTEQIRQVHIESKRIYGSPRIHGERVDRGEVVGRNTVANLIRKNNIKSKVYKRFVVTTDSRHTKKPAKNILNGEFTAAHPKQKWVSDLTFIPTRKEWLFLAVIMDLCSRRIVGWSMGNKNSAELVENALRMAVRHSGKVKGILLHSDQGSQYASLSYQ
jgi:transposase InsO family protein